MMLNLYVFVPDEGWSYCGGAALVIDSSAEKGFRRLRNGELGDFYSYTVDCEDTKHEDGDGCWLLHSVFPVTESIPRIVVVNYNWA